MDPGQRQGSADDEADLRFVTAGGVGVSRTAGSFDPTVLAGLARQVDERRGGVLSSGMEYPGRYSRWHIAYVDPCVEIAAAGRRIAATALNARGQVLLPVIGAALHRAAGPAATEAAGPGPGNGAQPGRVEVVIPEPGTGFTEEQRSRRPTVFSALREIIATFAAADPHLGLYGAFGYDLAFQFEEIQLRRPRPAGQRDLVLHLPDEIYVLDRKRETATRYRYEFEVGGASTAGLPRVTPGTRAAAVGTGPAALPPQPDPGRYMSVVARARERFARGDLFEVVPGHTFHGRCASPAEFYERLRQRNPAPYEFMFNLGAGEYLVGASPEMYVRVTGDRVETCPISGTIARGDDTLGDAENIRTLLNSAKEESELTMCTDVDRNDKSRVCVPGSVRVIGRRQIEMYSRVIHTVDHVEGRLRPGLDALDAFLTHMWAVTVTGAPKAWAMQFIEDHEDSPRRWYGGAVGALGFDGSMNTGLTLRTAHITGGLAAVRAGATLLFDSDPAAELRETQIKARALLETLIDNERLAPGQPSVPVHPPAGTDLRVLLVDHQDSFVHTLGDYFRQQGAEVTTLRAGFAPARLDELAPDLVVLSPGPGRPADFDCAALLDELDARRLPAFGVCLGLQAMAEHAGGKLSLLPEPAHGKPGLVRVRGGQLLAGLPAQFTAARYHSLYAAVGDVGGGFTVTATLGAAGPAEAQAGPAQAGVAMAIEDPAAGRWAVQFHPESILTAAGRTGHQVIANVLTLCRAHIGVR
jgi:anthranilate synthase